MLHRRTVFAIAFAAPVLLAACSETSPTAPDIGGEIEDAPPPPLALSLRTNDPADRILVSSEPMNAGTSVRVCLSVRTGSGWWKGVGINRTDPSIAGERTDGDQCASFTPSNMTLTFWKAKGLGVHSNVGSRSLDLSRYGGYRINLTWTAD